MAESGAESPVLIHASGLPSPSAATPEHGRDPEAGHLERSLYRGLCSRSFCLGTLGNDIQPLTFFIGKTATAVSLAKYYSAACLNIDSIVLEAISDGNNIPGIRARELCIRAAIEQSMREGEESGESHFP